jgi:hypothetical protein
LLLVKKFLMNSVSKLILVLTTLLIPTVIPALPILGDNPIPIEVKSFEIKTMDNRPVTNEALVAGASYRVSLSLAVGPGIKEKGILETGLTKSEDRYWTLIGRYQGIDTSKWQPGLNKIEFDASVQGTFQIEIVGMIPKDYNEHRLDTGEMLHLKRNISVMKMSLSSGVLLDERALPVIDDSLQKYNAKLAAVTSNVEKEKSSVNPQFIDFVNSTINLSKQNADAGYTDKAVASLNTIPQPPWVKSDSSSIIPWILLGVAILFVLLFILLYVRSRNNGAMVRRQAEEQARKLTLLEPRIRTSLPPNLNREITNIKESLNNIGGK